MAPLAPADIVGIWEAGKGRPDWDKALVVLAATFPDARRDDLASLSLGTRNAHLLALRAQLVGPVMEAVVTCPECGESLQFEQRIDELLDGYAPPASAAFAVDGAGAHLDCRLLTSVDLAAVGGGGAEDVVRDALVARTIVAATHDGAPVASADLTGADIALVADTLASRDPLAVITIPLACAACGHVWPSVFDIVAFLWVEIERRATGLLADVVAIAQAYGWSEGEILGMSAARRGYYLDAIG